jgi:hypothetical protein
MGSQIVDYKAVIKDLERKRTQMNSRFDAAITAIRQVLALESQDVQLPLPAMAGDSGLKSSPYRSLSMLDAAIKHIGSVGHGVPNVALARALEEGGYKHRSKNFANTLNSVLWRRAKATGDIRKSAHGWEVVKPA